MYADRRATSVLVFLILFGYSVAQAVTNTPADQRAANPPNCDPLYGLPQGTVTQGGKDQTLMSADVCAAYQFLLTRYIGTGPRSSTGQPSSTSGITGLNPGFAVQLEKLLKAMPGNVTIISAYRTVSGQGDTNPESNHRYGCAADLGWSQDNCSSQTCQWMLANGPSVAGIQIRMKYAPEWNHVEPINVQACRAGGNPGGGTGAGTTVPFDSSLRSALGLQQPVMNTQACFTSLGNPPTIAQPGTVLQSQCLTNANVGGSTTPPPPPPAQQSAAQPTTSGGSTATTPATTQTTQTTSTTPPPLGTPNTIPYPAGTCAAQTFCAQTDGNLYVRSTTCVDQISQQCSNGCTGNACNTPAASTGSGSSNALINLLLNPTPAPGQTPTSTPVSLSQSVQAQGDVANILPYGNPQTPAASNVAGLQPGSAQALSSNTFTSGDLGNSAPAYSAAPSTFQAVLGQMKGILYNMLAYLSANFQPFGGIPGTVLPGTSTTYAD